MSQLLKELEENSELLEKGREMLYRSQTFFDNSELPKGVAKDLTKKQQADIGVDFDNSEPPKGVAKDLTKKQQADIGVDYVRCVVEYLAKPIDLTGLSDEKKEDEQESEKEKYRRLRYKLKKDLLSIIQKNNKVSERVIDDSQSVFNKEKLSDYKKIVESYFNNPESRKEFQNSLQNFLCTFINNDYQLTIEEGAEEVKVSFKEARDQVREKVISEAFNKLITDTAGADLKVVERELKKAIDNKKNKLNGLSEMLEKGDEALERIATGKSQSLLAEILKNNREKLEKSVVRKASCASLLPSCFRPSVDDDPKATDCKKPGGDRIEGDDDKGKKGEGEADQDKSGDFARSQSAPGSLQVTGTDSKAGSAQSKSAPPIIEFEGCNEKGSDGVSKISNSRSISSGSGHVVGQEEGSAIPDDLVPFDGLDESPRSSKGEDGGMKKEDAAAGVGGWHVSDKGGISRSKARSQSPVDYRGGASNIEASSSPGQSNSLGGDRGEGDDLEAIDVQLNSPGSDAGDGQKKGTTFDVLDESSRSSNGKDGVMNNESSFADPNPSRASEEKAPDTPGTQFSRRSQAQRVEAEAGVGRN